MDPWVRVGEPPLRYFKNDYDKQPISYIPERQSCKKPRDEGLLIPFHEAWRIIKEKGWNKIDPKSRQHVALDNEELYLGYPSLTKEENPSGLSEFQLLTKLYSGDENAFE